MKSAPVTLAICGLWLTAAAAGGWWLHKYEIAQGAVAVTPEQWPAMSRLKPAQDCHTLVMFAHPRCPCTRASIEELNRMLVKCEGKLDATVLFSQPSNYPPDWSRSPFWNSAAAIPGVVAQIDVDGLEAKRFGAGPSGFVVLYDATGRLVFSGGITASRGHAGENAGADAIVSLVNGEVASSGPTPSFGQLAR